MMASILFELINIFETTFTCSKMMVEYLKYLKSEFLIDILYYILPIVAINIFVWRQKILFSKLFLRLDKNCLSVFCPSLSKREKLLKWASSRLPPTWSSQTKTLSNGIAELWKDGSLLCTLINSVIAEACPTPHRHWKRPPIHAQVLAYKYLALPPMFEDEDFSNPFTINQERNFVQYLTKLQQAINKFTLNNENYDKFSSDYIARGMGLYVGEQFRKTVFYIYSNKSSKNAKNILMLLQGPFGTHTKTIIPAFYNLKSKSIVNVFQDQLNKKKLKVISNQKNQSSFFQNISSNISLFLNVKDNQKANSIPIQIEFEIDRVKVTFIPCFSGIYEIKLITNGDLLRGSPYNIRVYPNDDTEKQDSFHVQEEQANKQVRFTKRRILSKVIDCIDETIVVEKNNNKQSNKVINNKTDNLLENIGTESNWKSIQNNLNLSSSICTGNIVGEDRKLNVTEKRQLFAKQTNIPSIDSSYSDNTENESESNEKQQQFCDLSVLNILQTLKQNSSDEIYSLSPANSLSDVQDKAVPLSSVKARRNYWEQMSSNTNSMLPIKNISEKNINCNKNEKIVADNKGADKLFFYALNTCPVPYESTPRSIKKFRSFDDSLENCSNISIHERKKNLFNNINTFEQVDKMNRQKVKCKGLFY